MRANGFAQRNGTRELSLFQINDIDATPSVPGCQHRNCRKSERIKMMVAASTTTSWPLTADFDARDRLFATQINRPRCAHIDGDDGLAANDLCTG